MGRIKAGLVSGVWVLLLFVGMLTVQFNVQSAGQNMGSSAESAQSNGTDWWPMFHHDPSHTGTSTSTGPTTNNLLWTFTAFGSISNVEDSVAVANGIAYVDADDGQVYALNATSGTLIWNYTTAMAWSSPAVAGGVVYVGSGHNVLALSASAGTLIWTYATGEDVFSSPAVVGGVVYVGSYDGNVYALNAATGALVWSHTVGPVQYSSPAVVGGVVYIGSWGGNVYALNAATGALVWSYSTDGAVGSSPAVVGGVVYVGSQDGNVYALNAATGALVWSHTVGPVYDSSPAVANDVVYIAPTWHMVCALNATSGTLIWNYTTNGKMYSSPSVAGGVVYVGSDDHKLYALNATSGTLIWNYTTNGEVESSPAVVGGVVYVGSMPLLQGPGKIYAFGPPPPVSISPTSVTIDVGQSNMFTSTVSFGTSPYTYQWYLNGASVSGATGATWTFTPNSSGSYTVHVNVTDNFGVEAQSNTASVIVYAALSVSISPTSLTIDVGQSRTFSSGVSGGVSPHLYQWYLNGTHVSGATDSTWTFTPASRGSYTVYANVTDNIGETANSNVATVTVNSAPEFPLYLILPLVIIVISLAILLAVFVLRRKRNVRAKSSRPPSA